MSEVMERRKWRLIREFLNNDGYFESEEIQEILEGVKTENLKELIKFLQEEVDKREGRRKEFEFEFEAEGTRRSQPYVAQITIKNGKVERNFKRLYKQWQGRSVYVYGKYTASSGQVIEKRLNDNDERFWYLVQDDGKEKIVANYHNLKERQKVIDYLKGNISAEELL